jgi:ATP-dependent DNA helicase DinG
MALDAATWERVMSDGELTLSIRCPHYDLCHYYRARRAASAAHVIVVNHALLLSDLALRADSGRGFLPKYDRVILDEAHHLEDAATGVASCRLTDPAVSRAMASLTDTARRRGALSRLVAVHGTDRSVLPPSARSACVTAVQAAERQVEEARVHASLALQQIGETFAETRRITPAFEATDDWTTGVVPLVRHLGSHLTAVTEALATVEAVLEGRHGQRLGALCSAPIEVGPVLQRILWTPLPGTACTSATLTVASRFDAFVRRVGLPDEPRPIEVVFPSPFDHARQAVLGLPRDLPTPDDPAFLAESARAVVEAVLATDGGSARGRPGARCCSSGSGRIGARSWSAPTASGRGSACAATACGW